MFRSILNPSTPGLTDGEAEDSSVHMQTHEVVKEVGNENRSDASKDDRHVVDEKSANLRHVRHPSAEHPASGVGESYRRQQQSS